MIGSKIEEVIILKVSDVKATFYDLVSYLFSGLLFLFMLLVFLSHFMEGINLSLGNATTVALALIASYLLGHALATVSSLAIEKWLLAGKIKKNLNTQSLLGESLIDSFKDKYRTSFKCQYQEKDFRILICFVEAYQPNIYSTAFVFLSIYGMCRNVAFIFLLFAVLESTLLFQQPTALIFCIIIIYMILFGVFLAGYFRFMKYFRHEILCGFLIPNLIKEG